MDGEREGSVEKRREKKEEERKREKKREGGKRNGFALVLLELPRTPSGTNGCSSFFSRYFLEILCFNPLVLCVGISIMLISYFIL